MCFFIRFRQKAQTALQTLLDKLYAWIVAQAEQQQQQKTMANQQMWQEKFAI